MKAWIESVFSINNNFDLKRIENPSKNYPPPLGDLLVNMVANAQLRKSAICVPRLDSNQQIWLYVVSDSSEQIIELRNLTQLTLGYAYCHIDPIVHTDSKDQMEIALIKEFPSGFLRISIPIGCNPDREKVYWVMQTLNDMITRYCLRPIALSTRHRPVGRILRDFFVALREGDCIKGNKCLDELRTKSQLSAQNIFYLEIQMYASAQKWHLLVDHARIGDIVVGRLPRKIVAIILDALAMTYLKQEVIQTSTPEVVRKQIQLIAPIFYRELEVDQYTFDLSQLQTWFIGSITVGNAKASGLVACYLETDWVRKVKKWAGIEIQDIEEKSTLKTLKQLFAEPPSIEIAKKLLQASISADEQEAENIVNTLSKYPVNIVDELRSNRFIGKLLTSLEHEFSDHITINGWKEFFSSSFDNKNSDHLLQTLIDNCQNWPSSSWDEHALENAINSELQDSYLLRNMMPILLIWLYENEVSLKSSTLLQLLLLLATDDIVSISDLILCRDLLSELLKVPHNSAEYDDALEILEECWSKVKSVEAVSGVLDIMEELLDLPCAKIDTRQKTWENIQQFIVNSWSRLPKAICILSRELATEYVGTESHLLFEAPTAKDNIYNDAVDLSNKKLAIYTLTEGAGRRAKSALQKLYPGLHVSLNHDKNASDPLINLAKTSDYFIFAAKSAAHQAFYPVTKIRDDLIYPAGKGSSSLVNAFINNLENI